MVISDPTITNLSTYSAILNFDETEIFSIDEDSFEFDKTPKPNKKKRIDDNFAFIQKESEAICQALKSINQDQSPQDGLTLWCMSLVDTLKLIKDYSANQRSNEVIERHNQLPTPGRIIMVTWRHPNEEHHGKTLAGLITEATPCEHSHLYDLVRNDDNIELKFHNSENSQLILNGLDTIPAIIYQRKTDKPAIKYVVMGLAPDNTTDFIERYVIFNHQKKRPNHKTQGQGSLPRPWR